LLLIALAGFKLSAQEQKETDTTTLHVSLDTLFNELDEVVITGTRLSKKIIDIPYPVESINYSSFEYDRKIGANDVLSSVPGIFSQSRYGNHDVRITIRGFGSRSNSGIRGVRILLDDIPESEPDGQTRVEAIDFNSIGRIEIAKGNASSMYTNAPGGVVNFINDMFFTRSFVSLLNEFGSFGLQKNGYKAGVRTEKYGFLATYSHQKYDGYREHNNELWDILNLVMETTPTEHTSLSILGYYVNGSIQLPGSLTREEFDADPYQADPRYADRDAKRVSSKGRLGIRFDGQFGRKLNNEFELTTYGTIKYFERTSSQYRIINRYGLGLTARYVNKSFFGKRLNEFLVGTDLLYQPARTEYYDNIGGLKGDQINQLTDEKISNTGFYLSDQFEIVEDKFFVLLTGRYDRVVYDLSEETLPSREDQRVFNAVTPKLAFNFKIKPWLSVYTSYGIGFDSPAKNELDSFDPEFLYNTDLEAQKTGNFEIGIKGSKSNWEKYFFRNLVFEATFFNIKLYNEIVPYEVLGEVFFRNAAQTTRTGFELGTKLEILKNLNFNLAYTYSHFVYDSYVVESLLINSEGYLEEVTFDYSGNYAPSIPKNNLFLALSYSYPFSKKIEGFVKVSYSGVSGLWVDDANSDQTAPYNLLNALLGLNLKFGKFEVMLSGGGNNLSDLVYVGFTNTNSADRRYYEAGAPRNYFVNCNLGYRF